MDIQLGNIQHPVRRLAVWSGSVVNDGLWLGLDLVETVDIFVFAVGTSTPICGI